jgi:hypothetical protein
VRLFTDECNKTNWAILYQILKKVHYLNSIVVSFLHEINAILEFPFMQFVNNITDKKG